MAAIKVYKCCICHTVLEEEKPIRLVKRVYGKKGYNQFDNVCNYDFCKKCYAKFNNWIKRNENE